MTSGVSQAEEADEVVRTTYVLERTTAGPAAFDLDFGMSTGASSLSG